MKDDALRSSVPARSLVRIYRVRVGVGLLSTATSKNQLINHQPSTKLINSIVARNYSLAESAISVHRNERIHGRFDQLSPQFRKVSLVGSVAQGISFKLLLQNTPRLRSMVWVSYRRLVATT
jgi:hypothetical protein